MASTNPVIHTRALSGNEKYFALEDAFRRNFNIWVYGQGDGKTYMIEYFKILLRNQHYIKQFYPDCTEALLNQSDRRYVIESACEPPYEFDRLPNFTYIEFVGKYNPAQEDYVPF